MLNESQIKQVLFIIVSGKGVIPYKKITLLTVIICVWSLCCSIWVDRKLHFLQILLGFFDAFLRCVEFDLISTNFITFVLHNNHCLCKYQRYSVFLFSLISKKIHAP